MKQAIFGAAFCAVLALGGTASAGENSHRKSGEKNSHRKCESSKAFVVKGVLVDAQPVVTDESSEAVSVDPQAVVTDDGVASFDVTGANRHARDAGHGPDSANDPGTYSLSDTAGSVKLSGYEEGEAPGAGDKVRVLGKVVYDRCAKAAGAVTIRKIQVIDKYDDAETPETETDGDETEVEATEVETPEAEVEVETVTSETTRGNGKSEPREKDSRGKGKDH